MKRIWNHPEEKQTGKRYWRSVGELEDTPEFREWMDREFPRGAAELANADEQAATRRSFMKLMGASTAFAGLGMAACRRPGKYIVPYARNVEWVIPGKSLLYTTSMPRAWGATPMVMTTYEGRPTHASGNPLHPANRVGDNSTRGLDPFAQGSILDLYDPARSQRFLIDGEKVNSVDAGKALEKWKTSIADGGSKVAFLIGEGDSPTRTRVIGELKKSESFSGSQWFRYESLGNDLFNEASEKSFGKEARPVAQLANATKILTLECDFMGTDFVGANAMHDFMANRQPNTLDKKNHWKTQKQDKINRLYAVESRFTVTGGASDHRLRADAGKMLEVAKFIAGKVGVPGAPAAEGVNEAWLTPAVEDLLASKGKAVVLAGRRLPVEVQVLVNAINLALGAYGSEKPVRLVKTEEGEFGSLTDLAKAIEAGEIDTVVSTTPADPVYDAPAEIEWARISKQATVIQVGTRFNASAAAANWHFPGTHYLEEWGDVRDMQGTYSVVQPMILPLFDGISELNLFLGLLKDGEAEAEDDGEAVDPALVAVKQTFGEYIKEGTEVAWNELLRDGFHPELSYATATPPESISVDGASDSPKSEGPFDISFTPDNRIWDGRQVNNGWLQEIADPITKLTWDNAALMSLTTAKQLGIKEDGQLVKVTVGKASGYFRALRAPGSADKTISISVGYGQKVCGPVGMGTGFDVNGLRTAANPFIGSGSVEVVEGSITVSDKEANCVGGEDGEIKLSGVEELAITASHFNMYGRALAREATYDEFEKNPAASVDDGMDHHIPPNIGLYDPKTSKFYKPEDKANTAFNDLDSNHQWAMTIDLNSCIGCNACAIACQSENNIPIVGKEQVIMGREMAWIRMDRYFATSDPDADRDSKNFDKIPNEDELEMLNQPVACVQCEEAPCETVCPVNATVHTDDGLNAMAYNRCIGTRYCANNCPYKARRFNFFDYNKRPIDELYKGPFSTKKGVPTSAQLQKNPNVTVRMRGVMEKCTYCVQRVQEAKINAKVAARGSSDVQVPANEIRVACQDACSANAIVFGNLKNPEDDVNAMKENPRNYDLLSYLKTRPRTSYLARVRNLNDQMPDSDVLGKATSKMH